MAFKAIAVLEALVVVLVVVVVDDDV